MLFKYDSQGEQRGKRASWARVLRSWHTIVTQKMLVEQKARRLDIDRIEGKVPIFPLKKDCFC